MKQKKYWILCLLLAAALLAGCTGKAPETQTEMPAEAPTSAPLDPELPTGELTENNNIYNYVNQKLGFGCSLNEDWFMVQQQDPQPSAARGRVSFTDLSAQRMDGCAGLNIIVEDVTLPTGGKESPERYRDLSLPAVQQQLEEFGCTNIHVEANTYVFVGQEYPGIRFTCTTPVQDWYCQQIVIGCGSYAVTVSLSSYDADFLDELAALFYPLEGGGQPAAAEENASPSPQIGIEAGEYRQPAFGIGISVEGWELTEREEIGRSIFGIPDYASYSKEELLANHIPYVEQMMTRDMTTVQLMLEQPPIRANDGVPANTPAEYMDNNARTIPALNASMGVPIASDERFQTELCGLAFEGYRCYISYNGVEMFQTMLTTEKDGVFFTIYITCLGTDESEAVLASFFPLA
jgi:hypothetical protein